MNSNFFYFATTLIVLFCGRTNSFPATDKIADLRSQNETAKSAVSSKFRQNYTMDVQEFVADRQNYTIDVSQFLTAEDLATLNQIEFWVEKREQRGRSLGNRQKLALSLSISVFVLLVLSLQLAIIIRLKRKRPKYVSLIRDVDEYHKLLEQLDQLYVELREYSAQNAECPPVVP